MLQARIGDIGVGICPCHIFPVSYITTFVSGAVTGFTNGPNDAIVGTVGVSSCGHPTIAMTGSTTTLIEGMPAHRVGDMGANCGPYTVVTGSPNTIVGG